MNKKRLLLLALGCLLLRCGTGLAGTWEDLATWKMDASPCVPEEIEKMLASMPANERAQVEDKLLAVLASPNATADATQFACRLLQRFGTDKCVPALGKLLCDDLMSHNARLALERMKESRKAGEALRAALANASDKLKPGLLGSLGERRDQGAVEDIGALLASADKDVAAAALLALGKIGGKSALERLQKASVPANLKAVQQDALMMCASGFPPGEAAPIFRQVYDNASGDVQRAAALRGLLLADDAKAAPAIVDLLKGEPSYLRQAALRFVVMDKSDKLTAAVGNALSGMNAAQQAEILGALTKRGDRAALDSALPLLKSADATVREAAVFAVSALGGASHLGALLALAKTDKAVVDAIVMMTDTNVDAALVRALATAPSPLPIIQAVSQRGYAKAVPEVLKLTQNADAEVREAAWSGLTTLATPADMDTMMKLVTGTRDAKEQERFALAVKEFCLRQTDKAACFQAASAYYANGSEITRLLVLDIASSAGGAQALAVVKSALSSGNKALHDRAVQALAAWPGRESAPDLLAVAKSDRDATARILALRGFIEMIGKSWGTPENAAMYKEKVSMYKAAADLAKRVDEKRLILSGLGAVKDPDALKLSAAYLDDAEVKGEAELAVVALLDTMKPPYPAEVPALLKKIVASSQNQDVVNKAKAALQSSEAPTEKKQ